MGALRAICLVPRAALLAALVSLSSRDCRAAIELVSPIGGVEVALVPDAQKKVMRLPTLAERIALFNEDRANGKKLRHDKYWRQARPLVLSWRTTDGEKGPWKVEIGKSSDLSDARVWYVKSSKTDEASGRTVADGATGDVSRVVAYTVPRANLEVAGAYHWRVTTRGRCGKWNCSPVCGCVESAKVVRSEIGAFRTEDFAPRWIELEGRVHNVRDFGGHHTTDGRRVRQGMAYRGQGLNSNSVTGEQAGANRLTVEDVKYLTGTLGIRTDLDLRSKGETADMTASPLGEGVAFVERSSECYQGIFTDRGKRVMAENVRLFCDRRNYPIYFHCIGGADRTGSLAYVLNGVLGVSRVENETDWEATFYPNIPDANPDSWCREAHFNEGFAKYGEKDDDWNRRIELYLLSCGITESEIATLRSILLEGD